MGTGVISVPDVEGAWLWADLARILGFLFTEGPERLVERVLAQEGGARRWQEHCSLLDRILSFEIPEGGVTESAPAHVRESVEELDRLFKRWVSELAEVVSNGRTCGRARERAS